MMPQSQPPQPQILGQALALAPRIKAASQAVLARMIARDDVVRAFWLATIADLTSFLLGPPGVAKTETAKLCAASVGRLRFYEALMPTIVSPEQLIAGDTQIEETPTPGGGKRISVVSQPGGAACADFALLDEIWKAQPGVLKVLFDLLRTDEVRLNGAAVKIPLLGVIAASNEMPEPGHQLEALWSRMAFRFHIRPLDRAGVLRMLQARRAQEAAGPAAASAPLLVVDDLRTLQAARPHVAISDEVFETVLGIVYGDLKDAEFDWLRADNRRLEVVRQGLQAHALLEGRGTVGKADLAVLKYMLWDTPEQIPAVEAAVAKYVRTPLSDAREKIDTLLAAGGAAERAWTSGHPSTDATNRLKALVQELSTLALQAAGTPEEAEIRRLQGALSAFLGQFALRGVGQAQGSFADATKGLS